MRCNRLLQLHGIREDRATQGKGFADQRLSKLDDPLHPRNRRISFLGAVSGQKGGGKIPSRKQTVGHKTRRGSGKTPEAAKPAEKPVEKK
jgi:hypothetical protein